MHLKRYHGVPILFGDIVAMMANSKGRSHVYAEACAINYIFTSKLNSTYSFCPIPSTIITNKKCKNCLIIEEKGVCFLSVSLLIFHTLHNIFIFILIIFYKTKFISPSVTQVTFLRSHILDA